MLVARHTWHGSYTVPVHARSCQPAFSAALQLVTEAALQLSVACDTSDADIDSAVVCMAVAYSCLGNV